MAHAAIIFAMIYYNVVTVYVISSAHVRTTNIVQARSLGTCTSLTN